MKTPILIFFLFLNGNVFNVFHQQFTTIRITNSAIYKLEKDESNGKSASARGLAQYETTKKVYLRDTAYGVHSNRDHPPMCV